MTPRQAFNNVVDLLNDYASFAESFDHEFHGPNEPDEEGYEGDTEDKDFDEKDCRFEQYDIDNALAVLQHLVTWNETR